jgi:hypothetical protein
MNATVYKRIRLWFAAGFMSLLAGSSTVLGATQVFTSQADFDTGTYYGVSGAGNQLELITTGTTTLPFFWVPNENETVSKVDTTTGKELGRYHTGPPGFDGEPSRTTVDIHGNCWVANRYAGSVLKIGLFEAGEGVDRNGNGLIDTSQDANNDGNIDASEMLPWGQDECVIVEVVLIPGRAEGPFVPGTYAAGYAHDWTWPGLRSVAADAHGNVWVGGLGSKKFYYLRGTDGAILAQYDVAASGHKAYGAVIDRNGVVWSSGHDSNGILKIDTGTSPPTFSIVPLGHFVYGLGLDLDGHLFATGWESQALSRVNTATTSKDWTKTGPYQGRGVVVTDDGIVWAVSSYHNRVYRYDHNGNYLSHLSGFSTPTGIAIDANGKLWVCDLGSEYIRRIDPATAAVDLSKRLIGSGGHYSYSDMTGAISRSVTTRIGSWVVILDGGAPGIPWNQVAWNATVPPGTTLQVRVRSSETGAPPWSPWEEVHSPLVSTPPGRFLQLEVKMQILAGDLSPELYDLTVTYDACPPPMAACTPSTRVSNNARYYRELIANSDCYPPQDLKLWVGDSLTPGFAAGPFKVGDVVRIAPATIASARPGRFGVAAIITVRGEAQVWAEDPLGQITAPKVTCGSERLPGPRRPTSPAQRNPSPPGDSL